MSDSPQNGQGDAPMQAKVSLASDIQRVLIDETSLNARVKELGSIISKEYADKDLLLIAVLKGSFIFMADLVRCITIPHEVDFMAISSYGSGSKSSGAVQIVMDLRRPLEGRHVLLVEDIIDSGHTLHYLHRIMLERLPASLRIMTLLDKPDRRETDMKVDWVGFSIPNEFVGLWAGLQPALSQSALYWHFAPQRLFWRRVTN
ncbi:MAG: hypoxanthine phosphoribosyltransferase [Caldilineaceae bacterium]